MKGALSSLNAMVAYATVFLAAEPKLLCKYNQANNSVHLNDTFSCQAWSKSRQLNLTTPYKCEWDTKYYGLTIINELNLICGRTYMAPLTQVLFLTRYLSS